MQPLAHQRHGDGCDEACRREERNSVEHAASLAELATECRP
jgi:hypothetical protein